MVPKKLLGVLRKKQNNVFWVASHINMEGDAIGAQLAMASLLRRLGKKVYCLNDDAPPSEYEFLPRIGTIRRESPRPDYDVALLVDCSDLSRIGKIARGIRKERLLLNIDHHVSNTRFGDVNWVDPRASSASEMVYWLFREMKMPLRKDEALLLYVGILSDTGSFKYSTTSSSTHRAAGDLLEHGLDVYGIYRRLHESFDFKTVQGIGKAVGTLRLDKTGKIAWLELRHSLIARNPTLAQMTDEIIHFARAVKGVEIAMLFKEIKRNRETRVNLRSRGRADVNALAKVFGGGGHPMASGCTIRGGFSDAVGRVVAEAQKRTV